MKILADQNVMFAREVFAHLGEVQTYAGRELAPEDVAEADLLICRSTRRIDASLLEGSRVRFVATATIGTDHVDQEYLRERGIPFASAAGCNANSVAEYIAEALLVVAGRGGCELAGRSIGVIGVGNVGSRVVEKAQALGMEVVRNDPPLARETGDERYRPLEEALACEFVTVHVPLTREGPDATFRMVNRDFIGAMESGAILLNSSRGVVVDEEELEEALRTGELGAAVLDVWDGEPKINPALLELAGIATPHIAGYSVDGKVAGTQMVYEAACRFLGVAPQCDARSFLPPPAVPELVVGDGDAPEEIVRRTCLRVYKIEEDDAALRRALEMDEAERGAHFDSLRRNYHDRREFHNTALRFEGCPEPARRALLGLGFRERH